MAQTTNHRPAKLHELGAAAHRLRLHYLAPVIVGVAFVVLMSVVRGPGEDEPQKVVLIGTTPAPLVCCAITPTPPAPPPIRIVQLDVEPNIVEVGQMATLRNGICNDSGKPIDVMIGFRAQGATGDPLLAPVVIFIGGPNGELQARTVEPGCDPRAETIRAPVDARLSPGQWRLSLVIMVRGNPNQITELSPVFEVRPAK